MRALAVPLQDAPSAERLRDSVDARLSDLLPRPADHRDLVCMAMREAALTSGKRTRPLMVVIAGRELGGDPSALLDLGCAVEMVHAASLVLDDMPCMDNATLRRGRPTIHRRFGEDVAALASVGLLSQAFATVAALPGATPAARARMVGVLATAIGPQGLVRGQCLDLRDSGVRAADDIADTNHLKTGALFAAALEMTALLSDVDDATRRALVRVALDLGQAFQLQDDLRDRHDSASTGKDSYQDAGKSTLLALLGADEVERRLRAHLRRARDTLAEIYGEDGALAAYCSRLFGAPR
ncbi:polyprenyl synthetase family protein [Luteimonas sp. TWI1416]|uniref:polyprenyl synthetase family protein n=1 Tax=unclassified Luteimonas TaxID=2629088 RepID=UPI0032095F0B